MYKAAVLLLALSSTSFAAGTAETILQAQQAQIDKASAQVELKCSKQNTSTPQGTLECQQAMNEYSAAVSQMSALQKSIMDVNKAVVSKI